MALAHGGTELLIGDRVSGLAGTDADGIHGVVRDYVGQKPWLVVVECDMDRYALTAVCNGRDLALDREDR